ncbi:hypothetical protein BLNAU_24962 [Blattamonas nauphoetae]|uniref:Uncharacterized protein n=1 Tax=Blattamonas nauphoetae TaxID=2049346 RepID=A0ABQ9WLC1_9EUKA|nr:hypothetical protein BLNAU_24962 [Blattamonas nauphoetae]
MVTADGIIVTFEHGDEETEGMQGELFGYWMEKSSNSFWNGEPRFELWGSIISLNNSFLYYHTRGPQTPLSNANIIKENINPGQSDHVSVEYTTSNATNSDTVILTYCNFLDISTTVQAEQNHPNLTKLCTFSSDNVFNKIEQLRMIFPPNSSHHRPRRPHLPFAPSLVQFTRQLVVQLASELHPQWTSVGDESDDGTRPHAIRSTPLHHPVRGCSGRGSLPSLFALLKEIGQEGASPNTSHFLVAQDSLNITILNKLPILPNFIPDTTSKEYAMKVTGLEGGTGRCEYNIHLRASSPFLLLHVYHSLCFFVCLGGVAVRTLIRQYHPAVLLFLADHSAAVGAEVQSNLIMWLVNSLFSDVHAIDQGRMDLLRSPLHAAAEGRGEEAAEPQHTRLHAAPVCGRGGAGVGAIPMGQGGGCGAVHVCVGAVGECPVTLHQLYLRQIRLDEPVSPSAHQIAGDQQDESSWSVFAALFPHRHVPIVLPQQRCPPPTSPRPHCPRRVFAVSELLGDEPGTTDATQPLLVAPVLRQQAQDTHLQEERAVFEAKHKVTCLDVVISWRVMTGMSILLPLALKMRAAARSAFLRRCCSTSRSDSVHIRTAEEMLLFDVELRFRPHPYSRRDASVRRRARRVVGLLCGLEDEASSPRHHHPQLHLTTTSRSAVEDSDAALRIIYSLALPLHTRIIGPPRRVRAGEEHASPDNHPRPHNHQSVREVAALVEKALDKRALNLSRDNRNEMQMAARQNTSPSRSILTCSHHPSRLQFSSVPHFTYDPTPRHSPLLPTLTHRPQLRHPMHLLLGGKGTVQIDHLLHIRTDTLRLFTSVFLRCSMSSSRLASTSNPTSSSSK